MACRKGMARGRRFARKQFSSSSLQQAISNTGNNEEPNCSETVKVQISCTPHGSKLEKPTDFFRLALADITKSHDNADCIKSVSYMRNDIFLVEIHKTCLNVIENLAGRDDLVYATRNIKIISIPVTESSSSNKDYKTSSSGRTVMGDKPKPDAYVPELQAMDQRACEKHIGFNASDGRVVEILGGTDGLGDLCQKFFERSGRFHSYNIESINLSSSPQTITFCSAQGARRFVQRRTFKIYGKEVYFRLCGDDLGGIHNDSASDAENINKRTVVLYGDIKSIGKSTLELYLQNRQRSGGGDLERIDLSIDPPVAIFCDAEDAERVINKFLHSIDDKQIYAKRTSHDEDKREESDKSVSSVESGNIVEIHGDIEGLSKDSLVVYLESRRRSGGGVIDEIDLLAYPPRIVFEDSEAAIRVVERDVHSCGGREFHLKFPIEKEQREEIDNASLRISNEEPENIVEIHGDIQALGKVSLQMYLENKKRSGGGEIEILNLDVTPPRVSFRDARAARRVVERKVHKLKGKEFLVKFPVEKNERVSEDDESSRISSVDPGNIVEIHGDIKDVGKDSLEMYLENAKRSGGGEIEEVNLDATPPRVSFRDAEAARRVVENNMHMLEGKEFLLKFPVEKSGPSIISNVEPADIVEIHGDIQGLGREFLKRYLENKQWSGGGEIKKVNLGATPPQVIFRDAEAARRVVERKVHKLKGKEFLVKFPLEKNERVNEDDESSRISSVDSGNIVEIHGDIKDVGKDSLEMYLENTKESGGGEIEEVNLDATPPRIIFRNAKAAIRVVERDVHSCGGREFHLNCPEEKEQREDIDNASSIISIEEPENIVEIHGDIQALGKVSLQMYLENKKRSGGGEIDILNLDVTPPRVSFHDVKAARRVVEKKVHKLKGKEFLVKFPVEKNERVSEDDESSRISSVDPGNIVEIHGDIKDARKDSLEMYLENAKRSGGGEIEEVNLDATPPRVIFRNAKAAIRVVERDVHSCGGREFHLKFPIQKEEREEIDNASSSISNEEPENIVEIHGDIQAFGKLSLLMYLENKKRSGGGEIDILNLDVTPPRVTFRDAKAARRVVERKVHKLKGKEFLVKFPVEKNERGSEDDESSRISSVDPGNIVEIHGDIKDVGKDSLEMYLENTKESGGGEIEEVNLDATPPRIIFRNAKAAIRVVERDVHSCGGRDFHLKFPMKKDEREEIDNASSSISNEEPENIVEIHGDIQALGKVSLQMYLENKKRSGGGEIDILNLDVTPPRVSFRDVKAARRVVERKVHKLKGKEFLVKFPVEKNERVSEDDESSKISSVDPGNIVEIHGDIKDVGKDSLEMYLENAKRSGGGEIEKVNLDATPPRVIFRNAKAARRVVERKVHKLKGKEFLVKFPVEKNERVSEDDESSRISSVDPGNIVEIHGDIKDVGKDSLEMYLENTKESGGGEIEEVNLDATPPRVIFRDAEAAARASAKESHRLDGIDFILKKPKSAVFRDDAIMLCDLPPDTSEDLLNMYLERLCGSDPHSIEANHDKSMVMALFPCKVDRNQIRVQYLKKPTLDGAKIAVKQVPVCNVAFMSNIPDSVSTDYLQLAIEKHCGSDSVEDLDYKKGKEYAFITFHNPQALLTLTEQEIKFEGKTVHIEEYYPSFITERIWKMMHKEPPEICINVDGLIIEHMMTKHKMDVCKRLKTEVYTKKTKSSEGHIKIQACFSRCADVPNQTDIFQSFYNEFIKKETAADFNNQGVRDLADSLSVTIHSNPGGPPAVVGRKQDVEKFLENAESSQIQTDIELPSEKIRLLGSTGYLKELEKELHVKIKTDQDKLTITGSELQIARVEAKLHLKLQNTKTSTLPVTDAMYKLLRNQDTHSGISGLMRDYMINFTLDELSKDITFLAMSQDALRKGVDKFKETVGEVELPLNDNQVSFVNGQRCSQVLEALASSSKHVIVDKSSRFIKFTGLLDDCFVIKRDIVKLLEENPFLKRFLPLSAGRTKAVLTICKEQIDMLLLKSRDSQVCINMSKDKCSIEVTGYGKAASDVAGQLEDISNGICKEELIFQRPGLSKVIALESSKQMIDGLQKEKKVIIIPKEEDIEGNIPEDETQEEYDIISDLHSSRLICRYQTTNSLQLLVFQGDITKHKADAIVNPANKHLLLDGGVAGAIKSAGGSEIQDECDRIVREHGGLMEGDVATTGAGKLPCRRIIHAVGPTWLSNTREIGEQELYQNQSISKETLAEVMKNLLVEAEKEECRVLAVPAISSGVFGFPNDLCASILVKTTLNMSEQCLFRSLKEVHFVNNDVPTVQVFNDEFISSFGMKREFQCVSSIQDARKSEHVSIKVRPDSSVTKKVSHSKDRSSASANPDSTSTVVAVSTSNGIQLELIIGDLATVKADVIVNEASQDLNLSRNPCSSALSKIAGKALQAQCSAWVKSNGLVPLYSFAETKGGKLQCKKVLHTTCGQYDGKDSENALKNLVTKILEKTDGEGSNTIAIPALGTGILKFPRDTVAKIMVDCVIRKFSEATKIRKIFLVGFRFDAPMIAAFKDALENTERSACARKNTIQNTPSSSLLDEEDMVYTLGNVVLEIKCGDITKESTDAIVVLGNQQISLLGAVGTAIKVAEGAELSERIRSKRPQKEGSTVLLKTKTLPSRYIAHIYPKSESYDDLKAAIKEMFKICNSKKLSSVSLPAIGMGVVGKSAEESAKLILQSFVDLSLVEKVPNIRKLSIVLFEERLVFSFKKKMREILLNPEEAWDKDREDTGVLAWIKKKVAIVKSLWDASSDKDRPTGHSSSVEALPSINVLSSVIFNLYFSSDKRVVKEVREKITKLLEDHITSTELTKEMYKTLPSCHFSKITSFATEHDVLVELDKHAGTLKLSGYHRDISSVKDYCHTMAEQSVVEDQKREKEQTVAKYVQWKEKQADGTLCDYDPVLNCQIETYFSNKEIGARVEIDEGGDTSTFELDFSNKKNMTITSMKSGEVKVLFREELGNAETKEHLPSNWDPMPKDKSGLEAKVHCVKLQSTSQEYQDIASKFYATSGGCIHSGNVAQILRIQNPQLYKSYLAKKESMQKTASQKNVNELELFHGTGPDVVTEINENGFNRSFAGVNGTFYGIGVYFAKDSKYSTDYANSAGGGQRCMYLAKVLAGKYTQGHPSYKVAPKGFDTVVDNPSSPRVHVVFYDNQCYPEYLLHFK